MGFFRIFLRSPTGVAGLVGIGIIIAVAVLAPMLLSDLAQADNFMQARKLPSWAHPFGTDSLGRDLLARVLVATQLSTGMAVVAELVSLCIALPVGAVTALLGPGPRTVVLRVIDAMLALPALIVTIYLATILAPALGLFGLAVGIALPSAFRLARVVSTQALAIAGRDYFKAARVVGVRGPRLLFRYVLPNIAEVIIIASTVNIAFAILALSGLSFLGIGVQPPDFDWGQMLTEGVRNIYVNPVAALGPLAFICFAALSFAFLGEALARAANPQLWTMDQGSGSPLKRLGNLSRPARASADADSMRGSAQRLGGATLDVRDLKVTFPVHGEPVDIVRGVSFSLRKGEMLGIVGESGSGKSMTAMAITHLTPYPGQISGHIAVQGHELSALPAAELKRLLGTEVAVVFQDPMSSLNPALTVGRQLTEGSEHHSGTPHARALEQAVKLLRDVNIPMPERQLVRYPHELSGGMRQRVMIAMGLMTEPHLLICDEPTTALDVTVQAQIMELLDALNTERQLSIVLISHNLALIRQNCQRVIVMYAGSIVEDLPSDRLLTDARHPYTRALIAAVPDIARPRSEFLNVIPGQPPDASAPIQGCAFRPRCPLAMARCAEQAPPLATAPDGSRVACWVGAPQLKSEQAA
jgi:peptide/nickel transport system permease protein